MWCSWLYSLLGRGTGPPLVRMQVGCRWGDADTCSAASTLLWTRVDRARGFHWSKPWRGTWVQSGNGPGSQGSVLKSTPRLLLRPCAEPKRQSVAAVPLECVSASRGRSGVSVPASPAGPMQPRAEAAQGRRWARGNGGVAVC
jgi:hypothetical protein